MKIRLSELRRIIREVIVEQGWVPGKYYPANEPMSRKDVDRMGIGGLGNTCDADCECEECSKDEDSDL